MKKQREFNDGGIWKSIEKGVNRATINSKLFLANREKSSYENKIKDLNESKKALIKKYENIFYNASHLVNKEDINILESHIASLKNIPDLDNTFINNLVSVSLAGKRIKKLKQKLDNLNLDLSDKITAPSADGRRRSRKSKKSRKSRKSKKSDGDFKSALQKKVNDEIKKATEKAKKKMDDEIKKAKIYDGRRKSRKSRKFKRRSKKSLY